MKQVILYSRRHRHTRGGVELFNENLMALLGDRHFHAAEQGPQEKLLSSYLTRLKHTIVRSRSSRSTPVIVQYGSFLDIAFLPLLRLFWRHIYVIAHVSTSWKHLHNPVSRWLTFAVMRVCLTQTLVLSEDQRQIFATTRPAKVHTILHPVFANRVREEGAARDGFVFIGRITAEKGIFDLIKAWAALPEPRPRLRLYGQGEDATLARLHAAIRADGLEQDISYEGPVQDPHQLAHIYGSAIATVYPSHADAFPLVMLESLSQETPCIISRIGEVPNFLGHAYPWLIEAGDVPALTAAISEAMQQGDVPPVTQDCVEAAQKYARAAIVSDLIALGIVDHALGAAHD